VSPIGDGKLDFKRIPEAPERSPSTPDTGAKIARGLPVRSPNPQSGLGIEQVEFCCRADSAQATAITHTDTTQQNQTHFFCVADALNTPRRRRRGLQMRPRLRRAHYRLNNVQHQ